MSEPDRVLIVALYPPDLTIERIGNAGVLVTWHNGISQTAPASDGTWEAIDSASIIPKTITVGTAGAATLIDFDERSKRR